MQVSAYVLSIVFDNYEPNAEQFTESQYKS